MRVKIYRFHQATIQHLGDGTAVVAMDRDWLSFEPTGPFREIRDVPGPAHDRRVLRIETVRTAVDPAPAFVVEAPQGEVVGGHEGPVPVNFRLRCDDGRGPLFWSAEHALEMARAGRHGFSLVEERA